MIINPPKKILFAIGSLTRGGAERVVSVWANQLQKRGYKVSILVFARYKDEYFISEDIDICTCAKTIEEYLSMSLFQRCTTIRSIIKKTEPDYIIPFLSKSQIMIMLASVGLKSKRIDTIRQSPWSLIRRLNSLERFLVMQAYNTSHSIIIQATDQKSFFSQRLQNKCVLVPNPVSQVYKHCYREDISQDVINFIAVGRIVPQKNYPMMIDAFASVAKKYPNIKLRIFGKGTPDYTQTIQNLINAHSMQEKIFLMGPSSCIEEEYRKNDIFLMTSDYEGLPNALIEAMASRLICITTDCKTGPRDLIDNNINGFMIPVGDKDALVTTIEKVMSMSYQDRITMTDAARDKIMNYCSEENSLNRLCSILI